MADQGLRGWRKWRSLSAKPLQKRRLVRRVNQNSSLTIAARSLDQNSEQTLEDSYRASSNAETLIGAKKQGVAHRLHYLSELLLTLVDREVGVIYKRSILGMLWTLLTPLLQLLICSFMFQAVLKVHIGCYASFAFIGVVAWAWFQATIIDATGSVIKNYSLLMHPGFPPSILPVVSTTTWMLHFLISLPVLFLFLAINSVTLTAAVCYLPLIIALQYFFTLSVAYPLAAINVTLRDTQHITTVLMNLLVYVTPIFYSLSYVPEKYQGMYALNPMSHILTAYRAVLLEGKAPDLCALSILFCASCCMLLVGQRFFKMQSQHFVEEL